MTRSKRWIFIRPSAFDAKWGIRADNVPDETDEADFEGHGTAILSKAVGQEHGVAKAANVVIVKFPIKQAQEYSDWSWANLMDGLSKIIDDIKQQKDSLGKVVVNCSFGKRS